MEVYLDATGDVTARMFTGATQRMFWWVLGRWMALAGVLGLLAALGLRIAGEPMSVWILVLEVSVVVALAAILASFLLRLTSSRTKLNEGHFHFVARDDGLSVEGPFGAETIRWSTYKKAYRDKQFIYLVVGNRQVQVIPLSLVPDDGPLVAHLKQLGLLQPTPRTFFIA